MPETGLVPCSPRETEGKLVYLPRLCEKIRMFAAGTLPEGYHSQLGKGFDEACCKFLGVPYEEIKAQVLAGQTNAQVLSWALAKSPRLTEDDLAMWSDYLSKRGWRDEASPRLRQRVVEMGVAAIPGIETFFDAIDADEGRPLPF